MTAAPTAPRRMLGRYEILDEIAQGAMGVVYKARDPLIDRIVAIKTITLGLSDAETEAYERRFFREAKSAGRLNHPNVVTIFDVGKSDDVAYIAMEFLDGQSLREILDSGVVLPTQRIAEIAAAVAEGLAFAHESGIVHRDVKPANIMVLASGAVKITDFGIALLPTGTRTLAGNAFGSPRYTSPEQVMGRTVDGRSDIFSLGATLYEMLTGASPFQGGDLNTILNQVLSEPTPPPSSRNPQIPWAFDHIVGKALAKDPADRYQTAGELAADLRRFDTVELATPGPGPLPALEHPTVPFTRADLAPLAEAPLEPAASDTDASVVPATSGAAAGTARAPASSAAVPWWKRRVVLGGALAAAVIAIAMIAVGPGGRDRPPPRGGTDAAAPTQSMRAIGTVSPTTPAPTAPVTDGPPAGDLASARPVAAPPVAAPPAAAPPVAAPPVAAPPAAAPPAAAPPAAAPPAAAPPAAAPAKPMARVTFAITPWGEIHVDGRRRGIAPPLQELRLPPGKHLIEVRNATFPPHRETIDVGPNDVVRIRHKFQ
ncbi:MAG: serine/threonine protein kinase [Burkholderiales bacterium]|nr:serine/threonine protein kinase [Burkholderiales bacterium]